MTETTAHKMVTTTIYAEHNKLKRGEFPKLSEFPEVQITRVNVKNMFEETYRIDITHEDHYDPATIAYHVGLLIGVRSLKNN